MNLPWSEEAEQLTRHIKALSRRTPQPFVVAIDGRSGAGKSTHASAMAKRLDSVILSGDDFFAGGVSVRNEPPPLLADLCIDWQLQKEVLTSLLESGSARYFPFDWVTFDGSKSVEPRILRARPVILFEGVYTARPELRDLMDVLVLVDVPDDVRMHRLLAGEGEVTAREKQWHRAEDWYFAAVAPRNIFDIVVSTHVCRNS